MFKMILAALFALGLHSAAFAEDHDDMSNTGNEEMTETTGMGEKADMEKDGKKMAKKAHDKAKAKAKGHDKKAKKKDDHGGH